MDDRMHRKMTRKRDHTLMRLETLQTEADRTQRLLALMGRTTAVVGDGFEGDLDLVEVGDEVFSKYGEEGVIVDFGNIGADNWCDVRVFFRDSESGEVLERTADRLNYAAERWWD